MSETNFSQILAHFVGLMENKWKRMFCEVNATDASNQYFCRHSGLTEITPAQSNGKLIACCESLKQQLRNRQKINLPLFL